MNTGNKLFAAIRANIVRDQMRRILAASVILFPCFVQPITVYGAKVPPEFLYSGAVLRVSIRENPKEHMPSNPVCSLKDYKLLREGRTKGCSSGSSSVYSVISVAKEGHETRHKNSHRESPKGVKVSNSDVLLFLFLISMTPLLEDLWRSRKKKT